MLLIVYVQRQKIISMMPIVRHNCLITEGFFLTREDRSLPNLCIRPIDWENAESFKQR